VKEAKRHLLLDLRSSIYNYPGKVLWSRIRIRNDGTVTGMRETRGWAPGRQLFFAIRFSAAMSGHALYNKEEDPPQYRGFKTPGTSAWDTQSVEGRGLEAVFDFVPSSDPLIVKVALSPVSEQNAIANMDAETPDFNFDGVRSRTQQMWREELSRVDFSASLAMEKSLYTALYHTMMAPSTSMDVNGEYRGPDNQVHSAKGFRFVSSLSLWDTYRAEQPLMTLIEPEQRTNDLVQSLMASQQQSPFGILPVWQFEGLETWCMIGYHSVPIIADAYMKGIRGYNLEAALDAMVASATYAPYGNLAAYMKLGYVPVDHDDEAASKTVEYAFDDWTIARMAKAMGKTSVAATFDKRATFWRNNFNTADGFVEPRLENGEYRKPFDPAIVKSVVDSWNTAGRSSVELRGVATVASLRAASAMVDGASLDALREGATTSFSRMISTQAEPRRDSNKSSLSAWWLTAIRHAVIGNDPAADITYEEIAPHLERYASFLDSLDGELVNASRYTYAPK